MKIIDSGIEITDEENIYQKLARATARAVDINLGKTTLADLLDGYTKYRVLEQRIDKAIEYINTTDRWLCRVNENLCVEAIAKDKLLEILGGKE